MRIEGNDQRLAAAAATQLQQTGVQRVLVQKTALQKDTNNSSSTETVQRLVDDKVSIKVDLPRNTVETLQRMGNISDFLNSVATNLRQTSEGLKETSHVLENMKTSLNKVIQKSPPYSLVDKERIEQLMSYSSLKKQIVSMMVPPPPAPIYEKVKYLWEDLFGGPNSTFQTPTLPADATNSHISIAIKQLDSLFDQVGLLQDALSNSVKSG